MVTDFLSYTSKYLRLAWAAPRLVMGFTLFFTILGWVYVWWLPSVYQSEARLHVDTEAIVNGALKGPGYYQNDPGQELVDQAISRLITAENLEKIAIDKELLLDAHTDLNKRTVLKKLTADLSFTYQRLEGSDQGTQEVFISYRDNDAARSRAVVGKVLDLFLDNILTRRMKDGARSRDFLDRHIDRTGALLRAAEDDLARFKIENSRLEHDQNKSDQSGAVFATAETEDQLRQLNSNYKVIREQHQDFLMRRKSAQIYIPDEGPSLPLFEIVEATRTLPESVAPNRPLLIVITFIGAFALGIAVLIFLHLLKPSDS